MNPIEPARQPEGQPTYVDPITGAPLYVDPATGQLTYGSGTAENPATPPPAAAPAYPAATAYPAGAPAAGYTYPGGYPSAAAGYSYPIGYGQGYGPQRKTNGLAIGALVTGIVSLPLTLCYGVGGILVGLVGAILGHVARRQVKTHNENGGGMALAGIICGWIGVALGIAILIFLVFAVTHMSQFDPNSPNPFPS